jgi:pimeloyl-ACP methyl ester carboxylesterase
MSLSPGKKIKVNDINYYVYDEGDGDKVALLIHGWPDQSDVWAGQIEALQKNGYRTIVPDQLGWGKTESPEDPLRYELSKPVADNIELLDKLGVDTVDLLIGHDWGAFMSWLMCYEIPDRIKCHVALSVGHPQSFYDSMSFEQNLGNFYMYQVNLPGFEELALEKNGEWLRKFFMPTHPDLDELVARLKEGDIKAMINWELGNPHNYNFLSWLRGELNFPPCSVPTLGIWCTGDQPHLLEPQMKKSESYMGAKWKYIRHECRSHWQQVDEPERINTFILDWVNEV